jgi:hypothetical protein
VTSERELRWELIELTRSYRTAQVLITCAELRLFEMLYPQPLSAAELAPLVGAEPQALERLLNAVVALGFLEKVGQVYRVGPEVAACLGYQNQHYIGNLLRREGAFYRRWSHLTKAVITGQRPEENTRDEQQPNWVQDFQLALFDMARINGPVIAAALESFLPDGPTRLLDVGGGHGGYSIAMAEQYPTLEAVVFELPMAVEVARSIIATSTVADRVKVQAGDFRADDLGSGFNLVFLFAVLVSEAPEGAIALLKKVYQALVPGGYVVVRGFYLDQEKTSPLAGNLFDLQLLAFTPSGAVQTKAELTSWLQQAGFSFPQTVTLLDMERSDLIIAQKPL